MNDLLLLGLTLPQAEFLLAETQDSHRGTDVEDHRRVILTRSSNACVLMLQALSARCEEHLNVLNSKVQDQNENIEAQLQRTAQVREKLIGIPPVLWDIAKTKFPDSKAGNSLATLTER